MKITNKNVVLIERAIGVKLYDHQIQNLVDNTPFPEGRQNGKSTVHCIKVALSEGEPLEIKKPQTFCDAGPMSNPAYVPVYARDTYLPRFMQIWEKLKAAGFPVRPLTCWGKPYKE